MPRRSGGAPEPQSWRSPKGVTRSAAAAVSASDGRAGGASRDSGREVELVRDFDCFDLSRAVLAVGWAAQALQDNGWVRVQDDQG